MAKKTIELTLVQELERDNWSGILEKIGRAANMGAEYGRLIWNMLNQGTTENSRAACQEAMQKRLNNWPTRELANGDSKEVSLSKLRQHEGLKEHGQHWHMVARGMYAALDGWTRYDKLVTAAYEENRVFDLSDADKALEKAEKAAEKAKEKADKLKAERAGDVSQFSPAECLSGLQALSERLDELNARGPAKATNAAVALLARWIQEQDKGDAANESQQVAAAEAVNE